MISRAIAVGLIPGADSVCAFWHHVWDQARQMRRGCEVVRAEPADRIRFQFVTLCSKLLRHFGLFFGGGFCIYLLIYIYTMYMLT